MKSDSLGLVPKHANFTVTTAMIVGGCAAAQVPSPSVEVATVEPSDPGAKGELFSVRGRHFINQHVSEPSLSGTPSA